MMSIRMADVLKYAALGVGLMILGATTAGAEKLKLGIEATYPPFVMQAADGSLTGFEPDLATEMCKRMQADCEFEPMEFKALIPSLIGGRIDMIVSQLTPLPERLERTEFTIPMIYNPEGFVVPATWTGGYDNAAFKGKSIGVIRGTSQAVYVAANYPDAVMKEYDNADEIKLDLLAGRIDAAFGGKLSWAYNFIERDEGKEWKLSEEDFWAAGEKQGMSWAAQKGNTELVDKANAALQSIVADCTYTRFRKKYMAQRFLPEEAKCE